MLTLCSLIWGTAFIAQSVGAEYLEPLTFNCARSVLATLFLFPCFLFFDKLAGKKLSLWGTDSSQRICLSTDGDSSLELNDNFEVIVRESSLYAEFIRIKSDEF
ncbi:MAG: EamA family transporter, partial [Phascolarctobacterium sp.]|nr:EamA family transporter [Phascolarctobacterium sp.]